MKRSRISDYFMLTAKAIKLDDTALAATTSKLADVDNVPQAAKSVEPEVFTSTAEDSEPAPPADLLSLACQGRKVNIAQVILNHWTPSEGHEFPKDGKNRWFQAAWLKTFSWLTYSSVMKGGLCLPCVLFNVEVAKTGGKNQLKVSAWVTCHEGFD